jgi:hypothetical protein
LRDLAHRTYRSLDRPRHRPQREPRDQRGEQRTADQPCRDRAGPARFGEHARLDTEQHTSHARHGFAQRALQRRSPRFDIRECPVRSAGSAAAHIGFGVLEIGGGRLAQGVEYRGDFGRRFQCPGEIQLRAQRAQQTLLAGARGTSRGGEFRTQAGVQGQRAIQ